MKRLVLLLAVLIIAATVLFFMNQEESSQKKYLDFFLDRTPIESIEDLKQKNSSSKESNQNEDINKKKKTELVKDFYLPLRSTDIIRHTDYALSYNESTEQAYWVAYELRLSETKGKAKRKDNFKEDPLIVTGSAASADYRRSGYDRGHLAPAADMKASQSIMDESFYYSNMSPQLPQFNRGIWKVLEERVRTWLQTDTLLYVITGPVFIDTLEIIGENRLAVPSHYFKIVFDGTLPEYRAIAFLMPNEKSKKPLSDFVVSIDQIEEITEIDFFNSLVDEYETELERSYQSESWFMTD